MAHELFGNRFVSHREPAWHGLGTVLEDGFTAAQGYERMGGYDVVAVPHPGLTVDGYTLTPQSKTIVRLPTPDDKQLVEFGTVGMDWTLIRPAEFAQLWDSAIGRTVETIGALKGGRIMFISTKLESMDVQGDEVDNYLLATNPMDGTLAGEAMVTGVRVVCQNTLRAAQAQAAERYRFVHDGTLRVRMAAWLAEMMQTTERRTAVLKEAFNLLAVKRADAKAAEHVISSAYVAPPMPRRNAPPSVMQKRLEAWEYELSQLARLKAGALELYNGRGTGADTKAFKGTLWGVYNAVAETEMYRRAHGDASADYEVLWGARGATIERAYDAAMTLAAPVKRGK